jgi:copper homeostasis protein
VALPHRTADINGPQLLHIKLYVLIRPRGGDFLYTDLEYHIMMADIRYCIDAGCDGVVIGMLNADGTIDKERCLEMVRLAKQWGLGVTFHRAFDMCKDHYQALEEIIEMGCDRILPRAEKAPLWKALLF